MESGISRDKIVKQALSYIDVPFRHRGRNKAGVDCAGLIICTLKDLEILPDDYIEVDYHTCPAIGLVEQTLILHTNSVDVYLPGDIVVFKVHDNPCHIGFVVDNDMFIHSSIVLKKVILNNINHEWKVHAAYRVRT